MTLASIPSPPISEFSLGPLDITFYGILIATGVAVAAIVTTRRFVAWGGDAELAQRVIVWAVILGFLAGLWFAPWLEENLASVFLLILILPPGLFLFAWAWHKLNLDERLDLPAGWEPMLMVPVLIGLGWLAVLLADPVQGVLFGGDMRQWLDNDVGISYDQRNAMVVGCAMGFAVIPIIFSIAEDAFSNVPSNLVSGSLALGANRWQTVTRIVLPAASPGILISTASEHSGSPSANEHSSCRPSAMTITPRISAANAPATIYFLRSGIRAPQPYEREQHSSAPPQSG